MRHIGWMTFVLTLLLGLKTMLFKSVDHSTRDLASSAEIKLKNLEHSMPASNQDGLKSLAGLRDVITRKAPAARIEGGERLD